MLFRSSPAQFVGDLLLQTATLQFYAFTLVLVRMSGLMIIGPALGTSAVPINIRIFLVLVLSMLITPTLNNHSQTMFQRLDQNGDHLLSRDEIPDSMRDRFDRRAAELQRSNTATLSEAEFKTELKLPATLVNYLLVIIGELSLEIGRAHV